jgi:hypothetical protein
VLLKKTEAVPGEVLKVRISDYNYYDLMGEAVGVEVKKETGAGTRGKRFSLPVVGVVEASVESKSKRR